MNQKLSELLITGISMSNWKLDKEKREVASAIPKTFATIVLPLIERFGDEAKEIIYRTRYKEGFKKGRSIAKKTSKHDDLTEFGRIFVKDMLDRGVNEPGWDDPARLFKAKSKTKVIYNNKLSDGCSMRIPHVWREMGLDDETIRMLGEIYCVPYDAGFRKGFNQKIDFKFNKLVTRGDPYCEWCEELKV
jgi:hypothetical protein